ncbi:hypothetical protein PRIPAC_92597 [Pristionchus pacificus]|uniref:Uncharacterized protein n=1 Tax=Pristionchus pacificus TaxID=54126 RepID=A0A2A6BQR5_PRIPA|nr:hypothetical protein PRIPAC_92597 [Pristionchus pacificus]|eukprot:PDM68217.1 hypothetical protein PRIPAC_46261 [Pristionchus pacificus]
MTMPTQWTNYGTSLPQIEETPKVKKPRAPFDRAFRHTDRNRRIMKAIFALHSFPSPAELRMIAEKCGLPLQGIILNAVNYQSDSKEEENCMRISERYSK